jgi:hypothetical protein
MEIKSKELTVIEKIVDVIQRNYDSKVTFQHDAGKTTQITFNWGFFGSITLKNMFSYWNLDWRDWVVEWTVHPYGGKVHVNMWVSET